MKYLKTVKYSLNAVVMLLLSFAAKAQNVTLGPEMADKMRSEGRIYVVVAVLTIIFLGIVIYLISLDRKLKKLEKLIGDKK
jgi:CcmD family protein